MTSMQRLRETRIRKRWLAVVFAGAACAGLLVGLWLSRNASFHRDQKCEKLYGDAWSFFAKKKIEDGALALNVLFTTLPSCGKAPDAGYFSGVVKEFYTHEIPQAQQIFRTVVERYPGSDAAKKAREKLDVYAADDFQWYRYYAQGRKLPEVTNWEDVMLPEIFGAYKDDVGKAILHLQFLREGKRILHDADAEKMFAYLKAVLLKAEGRYGSAQDILEKLAGEKIQTPLQQRAQLHLADVFFRRKKYKEALAALDKVTDAYFKRDADYGRGEIYFARNDLENALNFYERAQHAVMWTVSSSRAYGDFHAGSLLFSGMEPEFRMLQCAYLQGKSDLLVKYHPEYLYRAYFIQLQDKDVNVFERRMFLRKQVLAAFLLAASYEAQGKTKLAAEMYEKVLQLEKPEGDPDNIFPQTVFSAGKLYFNAKKFARASQLFQQMEKEYAEDEHVYDAKGYGLLCLDALSKEKNIPPSLFESALDKVSDPSLAVSLYYSIIRKYQLPHKDELSSAFELVEEEQAKRFSDVVGKKILSLKNRMPYGDVVLGDVYYFSGDMKNAMAYLKSALRARNSTLLKSSFASIGTLSSKPDTVAAYLKKCVQREKIQSLEKQIEKEDTAALHARLSLAYADIGWAESAFSQRRQALLLDVQSYIPQYKKDMEQLLTEVMQAADTATQDNASLEEGNALEQKDAAPLQREVFFKETLLKIGLSAKFPQKKTELERILNQGGGVTDELWASLQKEKTFYIPPAENLKTFQNQVVNTLQLFLNEESITKDALREFKAKCEELLTQLQEAEE